RVRRGGLAVDAAACGLAVRVAGAGQERAEAAALDGHLLAAIIAILGLRFASGLLGSLRREILNEIAFGITRAAEEKTVAADAFEQFALTALFTFFRCGNAGL